MGPREIPLDVSSDVYFLRNSRFLVPLGGPRGALGSSEMNYFRKIMKKSIFFYAQKRFSLSWDLEKHHWMCRPTCIF